MIDFSKEHPEVVRLMAGWMQSELIKTKKELVLARAEAERKKQLSLNIQDQLLIFRKIIFGRSEKRAGYRPRSQEESDLLLFSQSLLPPLKEKEVAKLPESAIEHDFTREELIEESVARGFADASPSQWEEIPGFYDESTLITLREREYRLEKHRRKKWRLKPEHNTAGKDVIITAPGPAKLIPGCTYSIDFTTSVVADKYISHMPLERQKREMESLGLKKIHTKTLYNLCMAVGVHLEPVAERIRKDILESGLCIHCDETPWPIQVKEQDDGYMWIIANRAGSFYSFEPTRSGKVIAKTLTGYKGPALADGYVGYNRIKAMEGITLANCWAHARRKFTDIEENYPTEAKEILDIIDELFKIERMAKSFPELGKLREEKSKKIIAAVKEWLIRPHEAARS
jgi:transposase